jgi:hypothetical protein
MASRKHQSDERKVREGDVLGISDAGPEATIPTHGGRRGHPAGIEVRNHATGIGDVPRSAGATGVDMGGGGTGTDVEPASTRRRTAQEDEEE